MGKTKNNPPDEEAREWEFPSGKELGPLLRKKREEMGLSYAQVSEETKLRPHFIEALENEDWEHLPSPAFVKGFIRSYARALGLSEEGLVALYQELSVGPGDTAGASLPPPVEKRSRLSLYIVLVSVFCAAGLALYLWMGGLYQAAEPTDGGRKQPSTGESAESKGLQSSLKAKVEPAVSEEISPSGSQDHPPLEVAAQSDGQGAAGGPSARQRDSLTEGTTPAVEPDSSAGAGEPPAEQAPPEEEKEAAPKESTAAPEPEPEKAVGPPGAGPQALILKAVVKERTWIRVRADNKKPKEYILRPGSRPQWSADKGFELLIGNAGGIELRLNDQEIPDLGKRGQVVRLKLPIEKERSVSEN